MFKIFGAIGKAAKAADSKAAEKIENANIIEFAKQDLEKIQASLVTVKTNIGKLKGRIQTLSDDKAENDRQIADHTDKATKLIAKAKGLTGQDQTDTEDLAKQHCASVATLQAKNATLDAALKQQNDLLVRETNTKTKLEKSYTQCQQDLDIMKTEKEVSDANKSITAVNVDDPASTVAKFTDRRRKLHEELSTTTALAEETGVGSETLDEKTAKLLGDEPGSDLFAKLKG
jgi:phage shock protein A